MNLNQTLESNESISTGSMEIDRRLGGGIPYKTLMLIEGQAASGKSTFVQQLIWGALNSGEKVCIYTTEQDVQSLIRQMESLGQDVSDFFLMHELEIFPISVAPDSLSPEILFKRLTEHMSLQKDARMIVVDALTTFVAEAGGDQIQDFFSGCKEMCANGQVIACTVHASAFDEGFLMRVRSIADAYIRLQVTASGSALLKSMEVAKIRGAEMRTGNITGFEVEPGLGIRIVPISRARA